MSTLTDPNAHTHTHARTPARTYTHTQHTRAHAHTHKRAYLLRYVSRCWTNTWSGATVAIVSLIHGKSTSTNFVIILLCRSHTLPTLCHHMCCYEYFHECAVALIYITIYILWMLSTLTHANCNFTHCVTIYTTHVLVLDLKKLLLKFSFTIRFGKGTGLTTFIKCFHFLYSAVNNENNTCTVPTSKSQNQLSSSGRPYAATLPRKAAGGMLFYFIEIKYFCFLN